MIVSAIEMGSLTKAETIKVGVAVRATVGRPIYSSVIDTVGVIVRETEA